MYLRYLKNLQDSFLEIIIFWHSLLNLNIVYLGVCLLEEIF